MKLNITILSVLASCACIPCTGSELDPVILDSPPRMKLIATSEGVLMIAENSRRHKQYRKALDSYAWVCDTLPNAPIADELRRQTRDRFVDTLLKASPAQLDEFGIPRARRYLDSFYFDENEKEFVKFKVEAIAKLNVMEEKSLGEE